MPLLISVAAACRSDRGIIAGDRVTRAAGAPAMCSGGVPGVRWLHAPVQDRAMLDAWCAGVGPAVTWTPADLPELPPAPSVAVISWNTNVGAADIGGLVGDLRAGSFTKGVPVPHFVLLLQEVHRAGDDVPRGAARRPRRIAASGAGTVRHDITQVARALGLSLLYVPSMANGWERGGPAEDRGNAILSTLPLHDATAIELPHEGQRRVVAAATVMGEHASGEPWRLRVVNVHLDNRSALRSWRAWRSFGTGRARQAEALARALTQDLAQQVPTVLAGDLNTWAPRRFERALDLLRRHFPHGESAAGATFARRMGPWALTLDHLMVRLPQLREAGAMRMPVHRLTEARGSDHFPLLAQLPSALLVTPPGQGTAGAPGR